jgi:hypothetical protein
VEPFLLYDLGVIVYKYLFVEEPPSWTDTVHGDGISEYLGEHEIKMNAMKMMSFEERKALEDQ